MKLQRWLKENLVNKLKKHSIGIRILLIFGWLSFLADSDSYYVPYLLVGIMGMMCLANSCHCNAKPIKNRIYFMVAAISFAFSVMVLAANYSLFGNSRFTGNQGKMIRVVYIVILFLGGYMAMREILVCLADKVWRITWSPQQQEGKPRWIFFISMAVISTGNFIFLFLAKYPGNLTPDSISQIKQILSGNYSNHHPFYHTLVIRLFVSAGLEIFDDINAAVALYHVFQILFMAGCFSFAVLTLWQAGFSRKAVILAFIWYAAMPFHIMYSFTMWKDVMFGGVTVLFLTSVFRILKGIGRRFWVNYLVLIVGGMGTCLFRSNGWFAFALSALCFIFLVRKKKALIGIFAGILVAAFLMKHAVLEGIGVSQPDTLEALSIPAQQIARVIAEGGRLTDEQLDMLDKVVDVGSVREKYDPRISDPVKNLVRAMGNQDYMADNFEEYLKLYVGIGLANPGEYVKAWIDQTKGYWNGGYPYWRWADGVQQNTLGIARTVRSVLAGKVLDKYLWLYTGVAPLQIFLCIGFHVWVIVMVGYICVVRGNREGLFLCIPNLAIILSLLIATPVYSEFRYAYSIFCGIPLLICAAFTGGEKYGS